MAHPYEVLGYDLEAVIAAADDYIAETNYADFSGVPVSSYEIVARSGIYGTYYRAVFTARELTDDEKIAAFDAFAADPANTVEVYEVAA